MRPSHPHIEDFPLVSARSLKLSIGNKRFNAASRVEVNIGNGMNVSIDLVPRPTNLGSVMRHLCCPRCGRSCLKLRVVPREPWLVCNVCLKESFGARFASQSRRMVGSVPGLRSQAYFEQTEGDHV